MAMVDTRLDNYNDTAPRKKRVCGYVRMAASAGNERFHFQSEFIKGEICNNPDWEFSGIYEDIGLTRTQRDRMLDACRKGEIDIIVTKNVSRFARDTLKLLGIVNELTSLGIDVYFLCENFHTLSEHGQQMLTIFKKLGMEEKRGVKWNESFNKSKQK